MFTGLIEEIGTIKTISNEGEGLIIETSANFSPELKIGESVAINGACQSVIEKSPNSFKVFCMKESLNRTNLKRLKAGDKVNLERAMLLTSRLDGHIVQGHIDFEAKFKGKTQEGLSKVFEFECTTEQMVEKGSVSINGVSLTISKLTPYSFCVSLIPQTLERTNLDELKSGDFVNIEVDIFAKYIEKFLSAKDNKSRISEDFLRENGYF